MSEGCPTADQLQEMLIERADAGADLEQHVEKCGRCQQQLDRLTSDGGFRRRLQAVSVSQPLPVVGEEFVRRLRENTTLFSFAGRAALETLGDGPAREQDRPLPVVPGYEVLAEIGSGGMGVIYRARHLGLNCIVALKMIRSGARASAAELARFRTEAEAVGRLQHPNILRVYDAGVADGQPYLALEFVEGGSLKERLDGTPRPAQAAARLLETLAAAVDAAHQQHILHRDLKPSNILLAFSDASRKRSDEAPFREASLIDGVPKIADFGLAKRLDEGSGAAQQTQAGTILGTPSYMAPEQARGTRDEGRGTREERSVFFSRPSSLVPRPSELGPATDVYALGAILYELLTGRPPFTGEAPLDVLLQVLHDEPVPVTRLQPTVPHDLATITHKCLAKEPGRRYASARDLADDLRRFREGQPILARPVGTFERLVKWARRRPGVAVLSLAVVLGTSMGLGLAGWQWRQAERSARAEALAHRKEKEKADAAEQARLHIERLLVSAEIDKANTLCERGDLTWGLLLLAQALDRAVRVGDADLERVIRTALTAWRQVFVVPQSTLPHADWVWDVAFSPDSQTVLTGSKDRTARLWDAVTGKPLGRPLRHEYPVWAVAFSPDGKTILTGCGTDDEKKGEARLWDASTGKALGSPLATGSTVGTAVFSADGSRILTLSGGRAQIWTISDFRLKISDLKKNTPASSSNLKSEIFNLKSQTLETGSPVWVALFSPDGRRILTGCVNGTAFLWDTATRKIVGKMIGHPGPVSTAAFSPDGKMLATGTMIPDAQKKFYVGGGVQLWDAARCKPLGQALPQGGPVKAMTFSPDGRTLLTGCVVIVRQGGKTEFRGEARLWNVLSQDTTEPLGAPLVHDKPVRAVAFSPDGRLFLTGSEDAAARLWLTATQAPIDFPRNIHSGTVRALAFSRDGRRIATGVAGDRAVARVWLAPTVSASGTAIPRLAIAVSPDGRTLLAHSRQGRRLWNMVSRKPLAVLPNGRHLGAAVFSPDSKTLIAIRGQGIEFRSAATGQLRGSPWADVGAHQLLADADGKTLWVVKRTDRADLIERRQLPTGKPVGKPLRYPPTLGALVQSDDGRLILASGGDGTVLWEAATSKLLGRYVEREEWVWTAAFSPGGKRFVTAGRSETAQLWESATGKPLGPPLPHSSGVLAAAFSRDGRTLLTGCRGNTARLWDVATGKPLGPWLPHRGSVWRVGFVGEGKEVWTSSEARPKSQEGTTAFWDVPTPCRAEPARVLLELQVLTGMELDKSGAVRKLSADEWQQRRRRLQRSEVSDQKSGSFP